jgi:hypothetical protein
VKIGSTLGATKSLAHVTIDGSHEILGGESSW